MENKKHKPMWELKQQADGKTLNLYIYDVVESAGYDWWGNAVPSETSADFFRKELDAHPEVTQINIYINSNGGSVYEGTAIYNQLRRHPAHKTVYVDGFACSIASVIAMAGDTVIMPRNTMMMVHNMMMGMYGNAQELRKCADDLDTINAAGRQAYLIKSNGKITEEKLIELMDAETWLTAEECIQYGFADEISETDADMSNAAGILQQANLNLQQRIQMHSSLAAQLKQLVEAPVEPVLVPQPQQKKEVNNIMALFGAKRK